MAKKKPRKSHKTSQFTWFHLKLSFFLLFFTLFFLFYPGNSYYVDIFAQNRDLFDDTRATSTQYVVGEFPFVKDVNNVPFLTARGVYIIDLQSATPVFEKNKDTKFLPASTTKIISALTASDVFDLDDILDVERVVAEGQSADLVQGERLTYESLLYAMLIHSGNDAAYVIADNYPGGYDSFIEAMNRKAVELKMTNSTFKNPAGFDDFLQQTTPVDLSLAARELLKDKTLSKIVSTKSITISDVDYTYFHPLYNINRLLGEIPGVAGLKTGKTEEAGENLVTLYKRNGHEYLIVLLNSEDRFLDTQTLVNWINVNVDYTSL